MTPQNPQNNKGPKVAASEPSSGAVSSTAVEHNFAAIANPLIARGLPVIPVQPLEKRCTLVGWPERATTDPAIIAAWNSENPRYNVACVAKDYGVAILDCDVPDLVQRIERETGQRMPATFAVLSAGRKCPHLYFRHSDRSRALGNRKRAHLFDWKAHNSYVVGPGSVISTDDGQRAYVITNDAPFADVPDWLCDWLEKNSVTLKANGYARGAKVVPSFDINAWLEWYGFNYDISGPWYIPDACPIAGRKHEQSTRTGFYFDGEIFGFHCFASNCPGSNMTIGQAIEHMHRGDLHALRQPYPGPIWTEQPQPEATQPAAGIDLKAPLPSQELIPPFPRRVMYGRAGELAEMLDAPLGYSYLAILAAAAGRFDVMSGGTRGTLYAGLLGPKGHGKSVAQDRAESLLGGGLEWATRTTPASDKGLQRLFPAPAPAEDGHLVIHRAPSRLLLVDELREMMNKASIENSTLATSLCTLFYKDAAGSVAKDGPSREVFVRLSILGGLAISRPMEFPQVFSFNAAHGLYDRFLFAVREVDDGWYYREWQRPAGSITVSDAPIFASGCDEAIRDWRKGHEGRERLGELAKRVALVSAALNGDAVITPSSGSFLAALAYAEYQEAIRNVYQPAGGADQHQECVEAILSAFRQAKGAANWRDLSRRHSWHRRFPKVLTSVKNMLERNGDLGFDPESKKHYLTSL